MAVSPVGGDCAVPTVAFATDFLVERPPFLSSLGGGTTCEQRRARPVESTHATRLIHGATIVLAVALVGYLYSTISVLMQEFQFRRDLGQFRAQLIALDAERDGISEADIVAALQSVALAAGVAVDANDVEVVAKRVRTRAVSGGALCGPERLPAEFDRLNDADRHRFEGAPMQCGQSRWIIGVRATVRAQRLLKQCKFEIERYTWVDSYEPDEPEMLAIH